MITDPQSCIISLFANFYCCPPFENTVSLAISGLSIFEVMT